METYLVLQLWGAVAVLYLVPWLVAYLRKAPNVGSVAVINVLLGWSVVGWAVALSMAARTRPPAQAPGWRPYAGGPWTPPPPGQYYDRPPQ